MNGEHEKVERKLSDQLERWRYNSNHNYSQSAAISNETARGSSFSH